MNLVKVSLMDFDVYVLDLIYFFILIILLFYVCFFDIVSMYIFLNNL